MERPTRRIYSALLPLVLVAVSVGCGGGGSYSNPANPNPNPPAGGTADLVITIVAENGSMSYSPNPATVNAGQRVAWRNSAGDAHTATQNSGGFDTGVIGSGGTSSPIAMTTAGTFGYHCSLHPAMVGTLIVR